MEELYAGSSTRKSQVSASGEYSSSYAAEYVFDGVVDSGAWLSKGTGAQTDGSCWLQWDFGEAKTISQVRMSSRPSGAQNQFPEDIKLYGSDTGSFSGEETHIQDLTLSQPSGAGEWCNWATISLPMAFQYLRIEIHTQQDVPGQSGATWVSVGETEFYESTASYEVAGTVSEEGVYVERTVRIYKRSTGELVAEDVSSYEDGTFLFDSLINNDEHYVIALDDTSDATDYNALIYDRIVPVEVT